MNTLALTPQKRFFSLLLLSLLLIFCSIVSIFVSPFGFSANGIELRLSRVVLALITGAALAGSGSALQAVFQNPLADPFILGVSGGAALGGTLVMTLLSGSTSLALAGGTFMGALITTAGVSYWLHRQVSPRPETALLMGVAINSFAAAVITLLKTVLPAEKGQSLMLWLVGNIGYPVTELLLPASIVVLLSLGVLVHHAGALNLLAHGREEAARLGLDAGKKNREIFLLVSLLVGVVVSLTGMIGFIGLIVPQILRRILGFDQRLLLPASALGGAVILLVFDTMTRASFVILQTEIPVGALTALFGAPLFAWMLLTRPTS